MDTEKQKQSNEMFFKKERDQMLKLVVDDLNSTLISSNHNQNKLKING